MNEFVVFVTHVEHVLQFGTSCIRGARVSAAFREPGNCTVVPGGRKVFLQRESFGPSRPGLHGKMLSHLMQEGNWIADSEQPDSLVGCFLVRSSRELTPFACRIELESTLMEGEERCVDITDHPIPVELARDIKGVLILRGGKDGELRVLASAEPWQSGMTLDLGLANRNICDGVAFRVRPRLADGSG